MRNEDAVTMAVRVIMIDFADRTGLKDTTRRPQRYLWTDAFAVCNFLSLFRRTGKAEYRDLAVALIDQVHDVLGRHRVDDQRSGWISGLGEEEGREHPAAGGLRIGKELNERPRDAPFDDRLEWDRDGQYFHYLTKWMHALKRAGVVTGEDRYCRWAVELAKAAQAGFAVLKTADGRTRLAWKMSIDLSYPLVPSTGQHDALDAHITYNELRACARDRPDDRIPALDGEIAETGAMMEGQRWGTDDPLGIGGLLFDACRAVQLRAARELDDPDLPAMLTNVSVDSLAAFAAHMPLNDPPEYRLAFRELGLSVGLHGVQIMRNIVESDAGHFDDRLSRDIDGLAKYVPLGELIEKFWSQRRHQRANTWRDHRDINAVMLATSLLPDEFLAA